MHGFVSEIVEGVRRPSGSPLRPAIDDNVDEEVNDFSSFECNSTSHVT